MHALITTFDNILFATNSIIYNVLNLIMQNTIIYTFLIIYVRHISSQKQPRKPIYDIIYLVLSLFSNLLIEYIYKPYIYNKHKEYITRKSSATITDMYMHALIDKYLTQKSLYKMYEVFFEFKKYINNYYKLYTFHAEIIVAYLVIHIAYKDKEINEIILIIFSIILALLFLFEYLSFDKFNDLHELFITSIIHEKLMIIFLIYVPYKCINNSNTKSYPSKTHGSLFAIFIILFWKISLKDFLNAYGEKLQLEQIINEFKIEEQEQLPLLINELSQKHNNYIYLIHDSNEDLTIMDYFKLVKMTVTTKEIISALDKLAILPELHKHLTMHINDESLNDEQKIKISLARALIIPKNYTVIYFEDDEIVKKYIHLIENTKICIKTKSIN